MLLIGRVDEESHNAGYWVRVGDDAEPLNNPSCNTEAIDTTAGKEQKCDLAGRYVSLDRPGYERVLSHGVAVFIECNSPLLPWDAVTDFPTSIRHNETKAVVIPLATKLETALGAGVCGELKLEFTNLPSFCYLSGEKIICTPNREERVGLHDFIIHQTSLENPLATKSTQVQIEVL